MFPTSLHMLSKNYHKIVFPDSAPVSFSSSQEVGKVSRIASSVLQKPGFMVAAGWYSSPVPETG